MGTIEIVVITLAAILVGFTIAYNIIRKIKGKSSCGEQDKGKKPSSCTSCTGCMFSKECSDVKKSLEPSSEEEN